MAQPLDAAQSAATTTGFNYSISSGVSRCLIVGIEQEGTTAGTPTCSYGGQSMALVAEIEVNPGTTSQRVSLFYLNDAGIQAAGTTAIAVGNVAATSVTVHARSYQYAQQTTPTNTDTDSSTAATPNPLAACDITTTGANSVVVSLSGMGNSGTAAWNTPLTERTEQVDSGNTATGSLADGNIATAQTVACECTWTTQNRAAIVACELAHDAGEGISGVTPSEFDMDAADVDVEGSNFLSSQGSGAVYISDADTLAGSANEVDISSAVNTWSDTVINLDLTQLSAGELSSLQTLGPGTRYIIVVNNDSDEYGSPAITLHRPEGWIMSLGAGTPGATTARLTPPSGKTTGDFDAGRLEEAANPATAVDITADDYTEMVWSIEAKANSRTVAYQFRVTVGGTVLDTYTVTPQSTISAGTTVVQSAVLTKSSSILSGSVSAGNVQTQASVLTKTRSLLAGAVSSSTTVVQGAILALTRSILAGSVSAGSTLVQSAVITKARSILSGAVSAGATLAQSAVLTKARSILSGSVVVGVSVVQAAVLALVRSILGGDISAGNTQQQAAAQTQSASILAGTVSAGNTQQQSAALTKSASVLSGSVQISEGTVVVQSAVLTQAAAILSGSVRIDAVLGQAAVLTLAQTILNGAPYIGTAVQQAAPLALSRSILGGDVSSSTLLQQAAVLDKTLSILAGSPISGTVLQQVATLTLAQSILGGSVYIQGDATPVQAAVLTKSLSILGGSVDIPTSGLSPQQLKEVRREVIAILVAHRLI